METSTTVIEAQASERAFIGAVLNGDTRAKDHGLKTSDFSDEFCKTVFSACLQLETQGKQADLVTMFDTFPQIDSSTLISLTQEAAAIGFLASQYAQNVRNAGQRRNVVNLFLKAAQAAQNPAQPLEDVIHETREYLDKAAAQSTTVRLINGTDALLDFHVWLENRKLEKAISTGIENIDKVLGGGLKGGRFYVVGARTGVGKSSLMASMTISAIQKGARVLYLSLEMRNRENITRMVASVSGVSQKRIDEELNLSDNELGAIVDSYALLPVNNLELPEEPKELQTPGALRRAALKMRAEMGVDMIVVDYIQLMQPDIKKPSRVEEIGSITRSLKLLAMEFDVPVLSAAQVNRAGAQGGVPRLYDLRESGSIEQDADVVFLMHREEGQEKLNKKRISIAIAKNRQGGTGTRDFIFDGDLMRYYPLEDRPQH